jgi:hypothetical protein
MAAPAVSPHNLRYPEWQGQYCAALLDLDQQTLLVRVATAETAILARLSAISRSPEGRRERLAMEDSLRFLRLLKTQKV